MASTPQSRGSRTGRTTHVACPRCGLRYRATVWQVFEDVPGNCPRCLGLHSVEQEMSWVEAPPKSAPPMPGRPAKNSTSTRSP
jgi:hypothetical protein